MSESVNMKIIDNMFVSYNKKKKIIDNMSLIFWEDLGTRKIY